jgi:hypothetical protein
LRTCCKKKMQRRENASARHHDNSSAGTVRPSGTRPGSQVSHGRQRCDLMPGSMFLDGGQMRRGFRGRGAHEGSNCIGRKEQARR